MIKKFSLLSQNAGSVLCVHCLITFAVISNLAFLRLTYPEIAFLILSRDVLYLIRHWLLLYWLLLSEMPFQTI